jgi:hypothetical protein
LGKERGDGVPFDEIGGRQHYARFDFCRPRQRKPRAASASAMWPLVGIQHSVGAGLQVCRRRKTGNYKGGIFPRRFGCYRRVGPTSSWRAGKEIQAVVTRRGAIARAPFALSRRSNSRALNAVRAVRNPVGSCGAHLSTRGKSGSSFSIYRSSAIVQRDRHHSIGRNINGGLARQRVKSMGSIEQQPHFSVPARLDSCQGSTLQTRKGP